MTLGSVHSMTVCVQLMSDDHYHLLDITDGL